MNRNMKRWMVIMVALAALFAAAGSWAQDTGAEPPEGVDAQAVQLVVAYAQSQEEIGPQEQAMLREQVTLMLKEMEALGYTRRVAVRAALEGMREAVFELRTRQRSGEPVELGEQLGDLLRTRLREQIRLASCDQCQDQLRERDRDRLRDRPDCLVPGTPGGNGPQGGGGKP
jgi:hypothetical protein